MKKRKRNTPPQEKKVKVYIADAEEACLRL